MARGLDEQARFALFLHLLDSWDALTNENVAHYLDLALADPDRSMAESAVIRLVQHRGATEAALETVERRVPGDWKAAHARLAERRVRLPVEQGSRDESDLLAAVDLGARNVQLWLLEIDPLPQVALERLADEGVTRAVRNRAAQRLERRVVS